MDEAFLNDLLECSVCLEQLDSTSKVLPCQHTFCKRCLEEIVNSHKELRCPECRILVEVNVEDLPPNILLIRLLEGIKNNPRGSSRISSTPTKRMEALTLSQYVAPSRPLLTSDHARRKVVSEVCEQRTPSKQVLQSSPCAKAIYSYEGKEPGDLSFKKGDIIILQKRIDQNWYHGEANGKFGSLPAKYVQVVVPLPTHIPQCKALYDFSIGNNEEKDCLTFKKGEVITVIRRIDDNWAEGKLGDKIGIFPISFVEMNVAARSLMKLSVNMQPGPSRLAPPTPVAESSQNSSIPVSKPEIASDSIVIDSSLSSTTTTPSPTSSSNTSPNILSSSSSAASLTAKGSISTTSTVAVLRNPSQRTSNEREKRHSFTSLSSVQKTSHIPVTHRHSFEILSTSGGDILTAMRKTSENEEGKKYSVVAGTQAISDKDETDSHAIHHQVNHDEQSKPHNVIKATIITTVASSAITTTAQSSSTLYMALYNYRPQKEDELELKKGEMYVVSEKCQDGWFKGTSILTGHGGVFPGNYVHLAKASGVQSHYQNHPAMVYTKAGGKSQLPIASSSSHSKPLPVNRNPFASANDKARPCVSHRETRTSVTGLLEWARSVTTVNNGAPNRPPRANVSDSQSTCNPSTANHVEPAAPGSDVQSPWVSRLTSCSQFPSSLLTSTVVQPKVMAASYPSPAVSASQNPAIDFTTKSSQSWHGARNFYNPPVTHNSIVSPPNVSLRAMPHTSRPSHSKSDKHKGRKDKSRESLMKRLTSKRKTRSPPVVDLSCDNPSFVDSPTASSPAPPTHARSDSCPVNVLNGTSEDQKCSGQVSAVIDTQKLSSRFKQQTSVRERFRCVVPYPPNSEYELELKVGDIVYVHKKRDDGWFKGTLLRTGKTGLFPASFVDGY